MTGPYTRFILLKPTFNINGDVIALCDDVSMMAIYNWKTDERAYLDDVDDTQYSHCLQVVFTRPPSSSSAHTPSLFTRPRLPASPHTHTFDWLDGTSVTPASILIRSHSDNPWASEPNSLELCSSSPTLTNKVSTRHGSLRCTDVILSKWATAVWIRPRDPAMVSRWEELDGWEALIAALFPGPLNPTAKVRIREASMNMLNDWTAFNYDEVLGRIAVESGFGKITIVQL
ncbi:hypothetical protein EDD85DRAFT_776107 [Armillaria nabsnona]|nr:hypothetical protein EDD85DRAFT_776107 [Armillaria nabsnona]